MAHWERMPMSDVVDRCEAYLAGNADGKRVAIDRAVEVLTEEADHAHVDTAQTLLRIARRLKADCAPEETRT